MLKPGTDAGVALAVVVASLGALEQICSYTLCWHYCLWHLQQGRDEAQEIIDTIRFVAVCLSLCSFIPLYNLSLKITVIGLAWYQCKST